MRVTAHQFGVDPLDDPVYREAILFLRQPRVENHLEEQVAKLLFEPREVAGVHGVNHFVGFFEEQAFDACIVLRAIPRAPRGPAQVGHQLDELFEVFSCQVRPHGYGKLKSPVI